MRTIKHTLIIILMLVTQFTIAQEGTQTIKGTIYDSDSEMPLIGASVELVHETLSLGAVTDLDGNFSFSGVPVGRQTFVVSYIGYKEQVLSNILVTAGKETVLKINLVESVNEVAEVEVVAEKQKTTESINEMATVSARQLTIQQVSRFSGGRQDISRLAGNFAGVSTADDSRNDIVIRGNSPTGVLWRMEGIPIPNPNHYSTLGTTGGPVSALNPNILENSDFLTGAFPAEYGNASAGVFDINLRAGNKDKFEFMGQVGGFSGLEAMAEGPLSKKKNSSFLIGYRYALTALAPTGTAATPRYQDLAVNIDFDYSKAGKFTIFGMGGLSNIDFLADQTDETDLFADPNADSYVTSGLAIAGLTHSYILNESSYIKTILSFSTAHGNYDEDNYLDNGDKIPVTEVEDITNRYVISSYYNKKFSKKLTMRAGVINQFFDLKLRVRDRVNKPEWELNRDFNDGMNLIEGYVQTKYRFSDKVVLNTGIHAQQLSLNNSWAIEPRAGIAYTFRANQSVSLAYGMHSQTQPFPAYFYQEPDQFGVINDLNQQLDFSRSQHLVLGYNLGFANDWRLKVEAYTQFLSNLAVDSFSSSFSMVNAGADFVFPERAGLVNDGKGRNYGLEITLEKFFSRGYYGLLTASIYDSKYEGSDGIERNSAFNNNVVINLLAGKEFQIGAEKRNAITMDMKLTAAGGRYYTPVDLAASIAAGEEVLQEDLAYSERYPAYFRLDTKFGYRLNSKKKKFSQTFFVDFQNVTNYQNIFQRRYNDITQEVNTVYQQGFFPDILYRIQF